jgi:hypothetical protein
MRREIIDRVSIAIMESFRESRIRLYERMFLPKTPKASKRLATHLARRHPSLDPQDSRGFLTLGIFSSHNRQRRGGRPRIAIDRNSTRFALDFCGA